jgi:hypothetical protein
MAAHIADAIVEYCSVMTHIQMHKAEADGLLSIEIASRF